MITWTKWNPNRVPRKGTLILAHIRSFNHTETETYIVLKVVKEDDVTFRTNDDNSEFNEWAWEMLRWAAIE